MKLLNVNRGRPALRSKKVKEIYEAGGTVHHDSVLTITPKNELESLQSNPNRVKFESPCLPLVDRRTVSFVTFEFNCSDSDEGKSGNLDDFGFGNITLKEIKESCKARKRKCAEYVDLSEETSNNFFPSKQDHTKLGAKEDELDLKEPLIQWKYKIPKNKKSKGKCITRQTSTSSQSATVIVKVEQDQVDLNILQRSGNLLEPTNIKLEVDELNYSNFLTKICDSADSSFHCSEQVDSSGVVIDEARVRANECVMETNASTYFENEQTCVLNEASCEYMEHADASRCFENEQACGLNEESCENMEHAEPESVCDAGISGLEIVNEDSPEIFSNGYPDLPVVNFADEVNIIHPGDVSLETISMSKDQDTDVYHNFQSLSPIHSQSWPSSSDSQVQALDMAIDDRLQCIETINGDGAYKFEVDKKDALPSEIEVSAPVIGHSPSRGSDSCLGPKTYLVYSADDFPLAEQKQPFLSACAKTPRKCSAATHPSDSTDELTASAESEDYHHRELWHSPERLLSTRKAISPTSQERLCKAMNSIELNNDKHSECRGKLMFGNQTENKVIRAEGGNEIRRAEITSNTKQILKKSKCDKKWSNPKANLKGSYLSRTEPSLITGCTPTQNLSQSAIAFSQRQMYDIESLATKLTSELSFMKELVKEMVQSNVCPATSLKHDTAKVSDVCPDTSLKHDIAKVTMAIKNASKAEETSKRWLSIMARDCSRFCKIMTLTQANSTAPGNAVHKERKKITFADEAGGKLCHVKVFKNDMASPLESTDIEEYPCK